MPQDFDLFGDPIPEGYGKSGRPEHIPTSENRNKVMMLLAMKWENERIASALHITPPTLRKHYFRELKFRAEARDRLDSSLIMQLWEQVRAGNVAAMKEFYRVIDRHDEAAYPGYLRKGLGIEKGKKVKKLGKKEQALLDANTPDAGSALGQLIAMRQSQVN